MDRDRIESTAQYVLEKNLIDYTNGVDVVGFAKKYDFFIFQEDMGDVDGVIVVNEVRPPVDSIKEKRIIGVNSTLCFEMKRFVTAHELGHYFLADRKEIVFARKDHLKEGSELDDAELAANYFAACLLMPKNSFIEHYNSLTKSDLSPDAVKNELKKIFRVPIESVARRITEVGV